MMRCWMSLLFSGLFSCSGAYEEIPAKEQEHEEARGPTVLQLSAEAVAAARIEVSSAQEGKLSRDLSLPARVTLNPQKHAIVSAWIEGQVEAILVRPGDTVTRGQVLARVQSPELGGAIAAFRAAKAQDDAADARLDRLRRLESDGVASRAQVLGAEAEHAEALGALEAAEERLRIIGVDPSVGDPHAGEHYPSRVPVKSPIAGKVLTADASVGERVEPGRTLFHVGDLGEVWLILDLYERDLAAVRIGQTVRFTVDAWAGSVFKGTVEQVGDWIEPEARTVEVRVVVENPEHQLKPNMFAKAQLTVDRPGAERGIVVPVDAIARVEGRDVLFVEVYPTHFEARSVVVAERNSANVRLGSGVEVGERIVISGAFALKSEMEKGALGEGHAH